MSVTAAIKYITRADISDKQWDDCIDKAYNRLIYAYSFYLDTMADDWDALVLEEYDAVMPLPYRKKWGIYYLYQPFLTAQLGLFGRNIDAETLAAFLQSIPKKFSYWDLSFNHQNLFFPFDFPLIRRSNFVLVLAKPYHVLQQAYRENIRRNIKKAKTYGCSIKQEIALDEIISLARFQAETVADKDFENFRQLFYFLQKRNSAKTYGVFSKSGELIASAVFLFSHNRAYYILVGNHPNGRTLGASHALIDAFIQDHANHNLLLDFEGSDIRNLAFFYSSFGAIEEQYAAIRYNRLPWWAKWLKN